MLILYIFLFIITFSSVRHIQGWNEDYLSFNTTNQVKGFFIILVFISHVVQYVTRYGADLTGYSYNLFWFLHNSIDQWIVSMFLFYSGYGIMESIKIKGMYYIANIPKRRVLNTLINFDIAVILFIIVALLTEKPLSIEKCIFSFIAWDDVGNDNWYIFVIILSYIITYLSFLNSKNWTKSANICLLLSLLLIIVLGYIKPEFWYNTILCFPAGIFYSMYRYNAESYVRRNYWIVLTIMFLVLTLIYNIPLFARGLVYNAFSVTICAIVLLITMKIKINSQILLWCGKNLFPIYIYQRIPMIILSNFSEGAFVINYPVTYAIVCMVITGLIAYSYKYWIVKL